MGNKDIIECNKLIAEFMGRDFNDPINSVWYFDEDKNKHLERQETVDDLQYHNSWDWLMPVYKRCIDTIGIWCVTHNDNNNARVWYQSGERIGRALSSVDIQKAHSEISNLIEWYNNIKIKFLLLQSKPVNGTQNYSL